MREEQVSFYSGGERVAGIMRLPDDASAGPFPTIVQGPGWLQLKEAKRNLPYHKAFTDAGMAVLVIDFRGFGESEGDRVDLLPNRWIEDLVNAVTYVTTRPDVDANNIGTFGSGSTGGGNAVLLAAVDSRVRCAVSQVPIADGTDWLRGMRREYEWFEFLAQLDADRRQRVLTGQGALVPPRGGIMVITPERTARTDVQDGHVHEVSLHSAEAILDYRPIDVAARVSGLMVIGVADDPVTPTEQAIALYERARAPKKLIIQKRTGHYKAYEQYAPQVIPEMLAWYRTHLVNAPIDVRETSAIGEETISTLG